LSIRRKLRGSDDGDRQMVAILSAVLLDGLPAVEAACAEALAEGVHSASVILNILGRKKDPGPPVTIMTPDALRVRHAPVADCVRWFFPIRRVELVQMARNALVQWRPAPLNLPAHKIPITVVHRFKLTAFDCDTGVGKQPHLAAQFHAAVDVLNQARNVDSLVNWRISA
jgi:hypothetical protein